MPNEPSSDLWLPARDALAAIPGGAGSNWPSLQGVLTALPAVSALSVAVLYGLGVLLNVTQLLGADVPVLDALPLIPLQDHLTKGLGAVFTSPALFVIGGCPDRRGTSTAIPMG